MEKARMVATALMPVFFACAVPVQPAVVEGEGGRWEELPPLPAGPRQESCVVALRGEAVVIGGFNGVGATVTLVEAYSPVTVSWRRLADLPLPLHHANCAAVDDRVVLGGFLVGVDFTPVARTLVYRPDDDVWVDVAPMPDGTQRGAAGATAHDGALYVIGGMQASSQTRSSRFDVAADVWQAMVPLPVALDHLSAHAVDELIFVVGGRTNSIDAHTPQLLELDPVGLTYVERSGMPTSRAGFAAAVLDGEIVVVGGEGKRDADSGVFDDVEIYRPATDTWRTVLPMRTPRHGMGAAVIDGALYVPGGADRRGFAAVATHERFVPADDAD